MLSIYYLFHTIYASARDDVSVWKGDALPMLFCRVDDNIHDHVKDGMDVPDGLDKRVGNIRVALYRGENGQWGFRTTEEDEAEGEGWRFGVGQAGDGHQNQARD